MPRSSSEYDDDFPPEPAGVAPIFVFTHQAIRELDRVAVEDLGLAGAVLMENAARSVAEEALAFFPLDVNQVVLIACGPGNNGGDGLALARHLHNAGLDVHLLLAFDPDRARQTPEAAMNLRVVRAMGLPIHILDPADVDSTLNAIPRAALVVDALLGTGLTAAPRPPLDTLIAALNDLPSPRLAVDIPSGLDADEGRPLGACLRADLTVTLVGLKTGFLELDAQPFLGELAVGDIGVPLELIERFGEPLETEPLEREEPERPVRPDRDDRDPPRPNRR